MTARWSWVAVLALVAAGALATAGPAGARDHGQSTVDRAGSLLPAGAAASRAGRGAGRLVAAAGAEQAIVLTVHNGQRPGRTGGRSVPARVLPPCYYRPDASGQKMADDAALYAEIAAATNLDPTGWYPPGAAAHAREDGAWYSWVCRREAFGTSEVFDKYLIEWAWTHPDFLWVPVGGPPPEPPVPPEVLEWVAAQAAEALVVMPEVRLNPADRAIVGLDTWLWFEPADWQPVSVTATAGATSVTVTAVPTSVTVSGLPAGSTATTDCAGGGRPWHPDAVATDCSIRFGQSSGGQPQQRTAFTVSVQWAVTAAGAPLTGPPVLTTSADLAIQVGEVQVVGSR